MPLTSFSGLSVAIVGPLPPPSGGMANQTDQLARLLRSEAAQVAIVQVNAPYRPAWVGRVPVLRALFRLLPYLLRLWRTFGATQIVHVMANSGWAWHLFAAPAVWLARMRKVPVIVNYRGGEAEGFFSRSLTWVKPTLQRATKVVVPSSFLSQVFNRFGFNTELVPNIIDLTRFKPRHGDPAGGAPRLLVARNLEPIYDIGTAIRAFAQIRQVHPKATLTVAGSGEQLGELRALAAQLNLADSVSFTGRIDNAQMAQQYAEAFLMLNPSLADNMPISLLEALASGVPVVSTDVGGIPYLVQHERTALLVPARDAAAMAQAALRVLGDADLRNALRANGLALARQFTWEQVRGRLAEVYRSAMQQRQ